MIRKGVKSGLLGLRAASVVGCGATPPVPSAEPPASTSEAPVVDIPREASEADLVAPERMANDYELQQWGWRGGRRYRFRRVIINTVPYYVPYYYPTTYPYYVPYYNYYDPTYYYVPAYSAPYFGARSVVVRYGRHNRRWYR